MLISSNFDRSLSLRSLKQLSRRVAVVGDLTLIYALYELGVGTTLYAVAVSDGEDTSYRVFDRFAPAEELFLAAVENGIDTASLDAVSEDMLGNNIL